MKRFKTHFNEAKDTHCSDKCCGADVKAEDCDCPADCAHCNCNAKNEAFDPKHPKVVAARKAHKAGTYDGNVDKNGNAIVHINGKPHTVTKGDPAAKTEAVDEGSIKGSGTDRKSVLKKAYRSGEQDTRQFNTPGGAATNKPKRGSDATVKKAYQAGRDSEQGGSAYKGKRRSKPQDTLGYKKEDYDVNELTVDFINEHNITLEQLENMTEEELNELLGKAIGGVAKVIGGVAKGAGRLAGAGIKRAVMTKQGSIRGTKAAKQDKAGDRAEKMAREREKEFKRKKRISDMKQRASDLDQKISDLNNK